MNLAITIIKGGFSIITTILIGSGIGRGLGIVLEKIIGVNEKSEFISNNSIIRDNIQNQLINIIREQLDQNIIKEKIIIYKKELLAAYKNKIIRKK